MIPTNAPSPDTEVVSASFFCDRQAIAAYLLENQGRIRAAARRKLSAHTRSVYDSEDVLASVLRRVDAVVSRGLLRANSHGELWALVEAIVRNNALNRTRLMERARDLVGEDGCYARELFRRLSGLRTDEEASLLHYRMMSCLKNEGERQILALHLKGATHKAIAGLLNIREDTSRQRWHAIRAQLRNLLIQGAFG